MTIGGSIFVIALGAILRFAVADQVDGLDLSTIGLILIAAGAVGLLAGLAIQFSRRRDIVVEQTSERR